MMISLLISFLLLLLVKFKICCVGIKVHLISYMRKLLKIHIQNPYFIHISLKLRLNKSLGIGSILQKYLRYAY